MGYMLMAGAVVTQPEGESRLILHTPQLPLMGLHGGSPRLKSGEEVTYSLSARGNMTFCQQT